MVCTEAEWSVEGGCYRWKPLPVQTSFSPAKGRNTNVEGVEASQGTAPGEQDPLSSRPQPSNEYARKSVKRVQIAEISSSVANDFSPTPIGISGPRGPEESTENPAFSSSSIPIPALAPQDDSSQVFPRSRFLGVHIVGDYPEEDSRSFRYFSNVIPPVNRRVARVQGQTVPQPPRKRKYAATENKDDDDGDGANQYATAHGKQPGLSQQKNLPNPSPDSRIQKIPTKNPSRQYYSNQAFGGWRVFDARNASNELEKEKREKTWRARKRVEEKVCNEAEEAGRSEYRKPPPQPFPDS